MKTIVISAILLSLVGCASISQTTTTQPIVSINISEAYASEPNPHLSGQIIIDGLDDIDLTKKNYGVRLFYFYDDNDGLFPHITGSISTWQRIPEQSNTFAIPINIEYDQAVDIKTKKYLIVLASICQSDAEVEILKVWDRSEIKWIK